MVMGPMPERAQPRCHSLPLLSVESNDCRCALLHSVNIKEGIPLRSRVRVIHCCSCSISWQICLIDGSKGAPLCAAAYRISLEMQFLSGPDVERLNERSLEDCLDRQRAIAIYIVGG